MLPVLFLTCDRGLVPTGLLVPPMKSREVARIPCLAKSRSAEVPVGTDFSGHGAQVVPKINDRRTSPKPVAVIDAVDHQAGLEHERMRDHRIIFGVGIFLYVEILLNRSVGIGKK